VRAKDGVVKIENELSLEIISADKNDENEIPE
jgi:hypothetical protein